MEQHKWTREIIPTYWCPVCKKTSVAERNEDGDIECLRCDDAPERTAADAIEDVREDLRALMK